VGSENRGDITASHRHADLGPVTEGMEGRRARPIKGANIKLASIKENLVRGKK